MLDVVPTATHVVETLTGDDGRRAQAEALAREQASEQQALHGARGRPGP